MNETVAAPPAHAPSYPADRTCPYALPESYDRLRRAPGSIHRVTLYNDRTAWVVTGHETARRLLADPRLSSDRRTEGFPRLSPRAEATRDRRPPFVGMDPPEHGPLRRMTTGGFTVRRVDAMRTEIEQIVHGLLDTMIAAGPPADLVTRLSLPVPSMVICRLLGVPYADHDFFQDASSRLVRAASAEQARAAGDDLERYLDGLVRQMEGGQRSGLLGTIIGEQLEKGMIDREEVVLTALLLLVAGHETTASMTSLGVITLLEHPEQLARLRSDRSLVPGAVEELLRYLAIADVATGRVATADIEIDGELVRAGESVIVAGSIANRDGAVFADPDTFDIQRNARGHLSFGYGVHQCVGQNLARVELEVVFTALLDRLPTLRLAVPVDQLSLRPGTTTQGVDELPVTW
ncbi:cytochrome P450 [Actinospica sp. MGRD01-02]|uniref:Cytochrome P450 n=1 Tax=Actinospica acidithermotolerans TaxID=2828514 RepID=A0A941IHG3_9ACTN|nr:cytochrome P450 [Actinospica acidithermotolerans]MBR7825687.1 cytochrome P450 [Actinospica acidithermotolerans]